MTSVTQPLEPTAAAPSVCGRGGRFVALWSRRFPVSGGCGSACRYALSSVWQRLVDRNASSLGFQPPSSLGALSAVPSSITEFLPNPAHRDKPLRGYRRTRPSPRLEERLRLVTSSASKVHSTNVSDHVQHLLALFLPIKSRMEDMRPPPLINISVCWECSAFGVTGLTGPQLSAHDLRGIAELGASLEVKVILVEEDELTEG